MSIKDTASQLTQRYWPKQLSSSVFIFALGLCILNGKQVEAFNLAIYWFGFFVAMITVLTAGSMSVVLTNSFSEMVSVVPFSGGCYGYVRCSLGPVAGYLTGMAEAAKYILYTTMMAYFVGDCFHAAYDLDLKYMPAVWLSFFALSIALQLADRRAIWWTWGLIALTAFLIQCIFIFAAARAGKAENLRPSVNRFQDMLVGELDGVKQLAAYPYASLTERFFRAIPMVNFLFVGIDAVRTCASDQSNKTVPRAMVNVHYLTIIMMVGTLVAARAYVQFPWQLVVTDRPYDSGFQIAFPGISSRLASLLTLPGVLGCALGFSVASGRQVRSMASSGLLPAFLSTADPNAKPVASIITCSVVSFSLLCALYFEVADYLLKIIILAELLTCIEAIATAAAYIVFATRFAGMERGYRASTGIAGAAALIPCFAINFITMFIFGYGDSQGLGITLAAFFTAAMLYYVLVVKDRQFYSKEEQDKFMKAYVVNSNLHRRKAKGVKRAGADTAERSSEHNAYHIPSIVHHLIASVLDLAGHSKVGPDTSTMHHHSPATMLVEADAPAANSKVHPADEGVSMAMETRQPEFAES